MIPGFAIQQQFNIFETLISPIALCLNRIEPLEPAAYSERHQVDWLVGFITCDISGDDYNTRHIS